MEKLYGANVYLSLQILDADTTSRQSIDMSAGNSSALFLTVAAQNLLSQISRGAWGDSS
ncbi:hypothetical protein JHK85_036425 [Glycine max]|nr:hypothetical protein JHK85_036425 [Glycine max]